MRWNEIFLAYRACPNPLPIFHRARGEALTSVPSPTGRGEIDSLSIIERVRDSGKVSRCEGQHCRRAKALPQSVKALQANLGEGGCFHPQPLAHRTRGVGLLAKIEEVIRQRVIDIVLPETDNVIPHVIMGSKGL